MKYCLDCNQLKSKKGKYCKKCGYKHRTRRLGLTYIKHKDNPTSFQKGHIPWHAGTKGTLTAWNKGLKGIHLSIKSEWKKNSIPWNKGIEFISIRDSHHPKWLGDNVGISGLHRWMKRRLGKPVICTHCGSEKNIQWANKSHNYERSIDDWIALCVPCHSRYDGKCAFSQEEFLIIKKRIDNGETQVKLAREFGVAQSTISTILNGKRRSYGNMLY